MVVRLFVAINFGEGTRGRLIALREGLRAKSARGNFSRDENLHLTLAFIGEAAPQKLDRIKAVLDTVDFAPFDVAVDRLGTFARGSLWWAGLREAAPLTLLQREITRKLASCGFDMDERGYHPHVTLAREVFTGAKPWDIEPFGETVRAFELMLSERAGGKLTYTALHERKAAITSGYGRDA